MSLNFYKEYICNKQPRTDTGNKTEKAFEDEIKRFEAHYQKYILKDKSPLEKDMSNYVNKVNNNMITKIEVDHNANEKTNWNQKFAKN